MKTFAVLVCIVATALCVRGARLRRDVSHLKQNSYQHKGGDIQVVKSIEKYAGTVTERTRGYSAAPSYNYGPPHHYPGLPVTQQNQQHLVSYQTVQVPISRPPPPRPAQVQPIPPRQPATPSATYGAPNSPYSASQQHQYQYYNNQQPTNQSPPAHPVHVQSYRPPQHQQSSNIYLAPTVEKNSADFKPSAVNYQSLYQQPQQPHHYQQYPPSAPQIGQHVHVYQRQPQAQRIQHQEAQLPVNSYGTPIALQDSVGHIGQAVNGVHDEPQQSLIPAQSDNVITRDQAGGFLGIPGSEVVPEQFSNTVNCFQLTGGETQEGSDNDGNAVGLSVPDVNVVQAQLASLGFPPIGGKPQSHKPDHSTGQTAEEHKGGGDFIRSTISNGNLRRSPNADIQSNIVSDSQNTGSSRSSIPSVRSTQQLQSTHSYQTRQYLVPNLVAANAMVAPLLHEFTQPVADDGSYIY